MSPESAAVLAAAARFLGFVGTLLVVGAAAFRFGVARTIGPSVPFLAADGLHRAARLGAASGLLLLGALPLKLFAQARSFLESGEPLTRELLGAVLGTAWGKGWKAQAVAGILVVAGFTAARLRPWPGWLLAGLAATAVVLAAPLTGHAVGSDRGGAWGFPLNALHVLAGGAWLGTLAVVLVAGLPATRRDGLVDPGTVANLIHAFSPIALFSACIAILAGSVLGFLYLEGSIAALFASRYGRTLLLKLGALAGVLSLGAYNWRIQRRRLDGMQGVAGLQRTAAAELTLGGILLAVTAVLVALPMPGED